jgi:hypothetical protein
MNEPKTLPSNYYIDKEKFYNALLERRGLVDAAKAKGLIKEDKDWPRVTDYIGDCFLKIATHLSYVHNFINYPFREEMILDGVENCLRYVDSFDPNWRRPDKPDKIPSAFAYFTQTCYYAFVRRIKEEKKELHSKYAYINQLDISELITQNHDDGEFQNQFITYLKEELDKAGELKTVPTLKVKKTRKRKVKGSSPAIDE